MATTKTKTKKIELSDKVLFYVLLPKDLPSPDDDMVEHASRVVKTLLGRFRDIHPEQTETGLVMSVAVSAFLTAVTLSIQALVEEEDERAREKIQ